MQMILETGKATKATYRNISGRAIIICDPNNTTESYWKKKNKLLAQKQTYGTMEHNRGPRNKPTQL